MRLYAKWIAYSLLVVLAVAIKTARADDADESPLTPRQQAVADRIEGIRTQYLSSSDLALRALYSLDGLEQLPDKTFRTHEDIPTAALLDLARGSTDPLLLDILLVRCLSPACDRVDLATRWTQADTQNQVAWLVLASAQKQRGDLAAARETFLRASQASTWHGHYNDAVRRGARALPPDLSAPERAAALAWVFAKSGIVTPFPALHALGDFCKDAYASRQACARILETMVRDSDDLMALTVSVAYAARAGIDQQIVAGYRQKSDAMHWAMTHIAWSLPDADGSEPEDSLELRASIRQLEARIDKGERRVLEQYLLEQHLTEAEAARRQVATLTAFQIQRRAAILKGG